MENFTFYSPTYFVFGKDEENKAGELVKKFGGSRVLVVYGGGSVVGAAAHHGAAMGIVGFSDDCHGASGISHGAEVVPGRQGAIGCKRRAGYVQDGIVERCIEEDVGACLRRVGGGDPHVGQR